MKVTMATQFDFVNAKKRTKWPFSRMEVGDIVCISECEYSNTRIQRRAHAYGHSTGKSFTCKAIDGKVFVKRVS